MQCVRGDIQTYAEQHTEAASPLLLQIWQDTHARVPAPQMMAGHLQGRILATFSHMLRPSKILELGTYTGYSALCLAEGLLPGGRLHTIDNDGSLSEVVKRYFERSGKADQICYHLGNAADVIPQLDETFDLVYIDADKKNYLHYYDLVLDRVRSGGFVIADNVLWGGSVLPNGETVLSDKRDKRTRAMREFNEYTHQDSRVANVLFPVRDGLMVLRKK